MKKITLLILGLLFLAGCETTKTVVGGVAGGTMAVGQSLATDTKNAYSALKKADDWFQENYW
ncbi:MAG: hypothetical protein AB1472_00610 [Candidatus Omnitrophota bacterium]